MALFVFVSASGSPGVTSTVVGLALGWPRPVLVVEADPTGGSGILAGLFKGQVDHPGLVELVLAHRNGVLGEALPRMRMPVDGTSVSVLCGAKSHEQAAGLAGLWEPLLPVLRELAGSGMDVLVDAGRLGLTGWPRPLVAGADVSVLVSRSSLPALVAARSWAASLAAEAVPGHAVRLLLVGEGRPYAAGEVSRTLGLASAGSIGWDPVRAAVFSEGAAKPRTWGGPGRAERAFAASGYVRSLQAAGEGLRNVAAGVVADDPLLRGLVAARVEGATR